MAQFVRVEPSFMMSSLQVDGRLRLRGLYRFLWPLLRAYQIRSALCLKHENRVSIRVGATDRPSNHWKMAVLNFGARGWFRRTALGYGARCKKGLPNASCRLRQQGDRDFRLCLEN
jgi:hypothetical protein